jgi:hypothetical protein
VLKHSLDFFYGENMAIDLKKHHTIQEKFAKSIDSLRNIIERKSIGTALSRDIPGSKFAKAPGFANVNKSLINLFPTIFKTAGTQFFIWLKDGFSEAFRNIRSTYMEIMGKIHTTFISPLISIGAHIKKGFAKLFLRQDKSDSESRGRKGGIMKLIGGIFLILGIAIGIFASKLQLAANILLAPIKLFAWAFEKITKIKLLGKGNFFGKIGKFFEVLEKTSKNPLLRKLGLGFKLGKKFFWPIQAVMSIYDFFTGYSGEKGSTLDKIVAGLKNVFKGLIDIFVQPFAWVINKFLKWTGFKEIPDLGNKIIDILFWPIEIALRGLALAGEKLQPVFAFIGKGIGIAIRFIGDLGLMIWNLWKFLGNTYIEFIKWEGNTIGKIIRFIMDMGSSIFNFFKNIKENAPKLIDKIIRVIMDIGSSIFNFFKNIKENVQKIIDKYNPANWFKDEENATFSVPSKSPISNLSDTIVAGEIKNVRVMGVMASNGMKTAMAEQTSTLGNKMQGFFNTTNINTQNSVIAPSHVVNNSDNTRSYDTEVDSLNNTW